jgi:hypothetical protein
MLFIQILNKEYSTIRDNNVVIYGGHRSLLVCQGKGGWPCLWLDVVVEVEAAGVAVCGRK